MKSICLLPHSPPKKLAQGISDMPTKNMISPITADIPKLIRNILQNNPQANLQVGLTSLFI
jgi:hypothetical protein